jgi:hypothetical protein
VLAHRLTESRQVVDGSASIPALTRREVDAVGSAEVALEFGMAA